MAMFIMVDGAPKVTYGSTLAIAGIGTPQTFTGLTFPGDVAADRLLVAAVMAVTGGTAPTAVTIGGVTATQVVTVSSPGAGNWCAQLWIAAVPTGTSGDVVVSGHSAPGNNSMAVSSYALNGVSSATAAATATDNATPFSQSLTVPEQGAVIACLAGATSASSTWSGVTEDVDSNTNVGVTFLHYTSASDDGYPAGATTITCTLTASGNTAFVAATWGA